MKAPSSIIFDLGGVLYDIDPQLSFEAFRRLGINDFKVYYSFKSQMDVFDDLEKGLISAGEFCGSIRQISGLDLTDEQITESWNALLVGMPLENIQLLRDISGKYRIFLLSNTNVLHLNQIHDEMVSKGLSSLDELFEKAFYSFKMGMRKPGVEIYREVLNQAGLNAAGALFIDDNKDNIEGALEAGIPSLIKDRTQSLRDFLLENGLI